MRLACMRSYSSLEPTIILSNSRRPVPVNDDQDPLHIRMGNPDLQPTQTHAFDARLDLTRRCPLCANSFFANINIYRGSVSQGYTYNPTTGVYIYRPMNVDGNWNASLRFASQGYLDKRNQFFYTLNLIGIYSRHVDYAALADCGNAAVQQTVLSHVNNWNMGPDLRLSYQQKVYSISIMCGFNYRYATQREGTVDNVNAVYSSYGLNG